MVWVQNFCFDCSWGQGKQLNLKGTGPIKTIFFSNIYLIIDLSTAFNLSLLVFVVFHDYNSDTIGFVLQIVHTETLK